MITYTLNAIKRLMKFLFPEPLLVKERFFDPDFFIDIYSSDKSYLRMVTAVPDVFTYLTWLQDVNRQLEENVRIHEREVKYGLIYISDFFKIKGFYLDNPREIIEVFLVEAEHFLERYDNLDERDPVQSYNQRSLANLKANLDAIGVIFNERVKL